MKIIRSINARSGFTLTELIIATTIMTFAVTMCVSGFIYVLKSTQQSEVQRELDNNLQEAMERIKYGLRLTDRDKVLFYPPGTGIIHTAISFPESSNYAATGMAVLDASNRIVWGKTVIYHAWTAPESNQLRRTTFSPRNQSRSVTELQTQLAQVVQYGNGKNSNVMDHANATTEVVFENVFDWSLTEIGGDFDGYAPTTQRVENVNLGMVIIADGNHEVKFTTIGKNANSSGYKTGIDSLSVSPSGSKREAEAQIVSSCSPAGALQTNYMPQVTWDGNYQLYFNAAAINTYFSLTMTNDVWENTNFRGLGEVNDHTDVKWDDSTSPMDFVAQLAGAGTNWSAASQTADQTGYSSPSLNAMGVRVVIRGEDSDTDAKIMNDGAMCLLNFKAGTGQALCISNVTIAQAISSSNSPDFVAGTSVNLTFSNGLSRAFTIPTGSDAWTDAVVFPGGIVKSNSYVVSFMVKDDVTADRGWAWTDTNYPAAPSCYIMSGATATDMASAHWDSTQYVASAAILAAQYLGLSYWTNGEYTSEIFDTKTLATNVNYSHMSWNATAPAGTSLGMQVRTGYNSDLSDSAWSTNWQTSSPYAMSSGGKYVQFKAKFTPDTTDYMLTPKLKNVSIGWVGDTKAVSISGAFTKGPDYGIFQCTVDGQLLRKAIGVTMSIFKSAPVYGGGTNTLTSVLTAEVQPRNTGK